VVPDDTLEERPAGLGTVEDTSVGELDLAEGEVIDDAPPQIFAVKRRREASLPALEEALHRAGPEAITDALEQRRVLAGQKAVVEFLERHPGLFELAL